MSAAPFDTALVIARLDLESTGLRQVGTAGDYEAVEKLSGFVVPSAFVILMAEVPVETRSGQSLPGAQQRLQQMVEVHLGVVMAFRNYRGLTRGDDLRQALREGVGKVRNRLLGWTPPVPGGRQLQLVRGDLIDSDASTVLWGDAWKTQHVIKPEISA